MIADIVRQLGPIGFTFTFIAVLGIAGLIQENWRN